MELSEFVRNGGPMPTGVETFAPSLSDAGWVARLLNPDIDSDRSPRLGLDWDSSTVTFTNLLRPNTFWPKKTLRHFSVSFDDPLEVLVKYIEGTNYLIVRTHGAECGFTRDFWQYDEIRDRFALIREIDAIDHDGSWRSWRSELPYIVGGHHRHDHHLGLVRRHVRRCSRPDQEIETDGPARIRFLSEPAD